MAATRVMGIEVAMKITAAVSVVSLWTILGTALALEGSTVRLGKGVARMIRVIVAGKLLGCGDAASLAAVETVESFRSEVVVGTRVARTATEVAGGLLCKFVGTALFAVNIGPEVSTPKTIRSRAARALNAPILSIAR